MALANILQNHSESKITRGEIFFFLGLGLILALIFYFINLKSLDHDQIRPTLIFFKEKTRLAHSPGSSINDWIFVAPFIPYTVVLYLRDPMLAAAVAGGIAMSCWLFVVFRLFKRRQVSGAVAIMMALFLIFSPTSLNFFSQKIELVLYFTFFLTGLYALRCYYFENRASEYLLFGLASGLLIQNTLSTSWIFLAFLIPAIIVIVALEKPLIPFLVALLYPMLFFILLPMCLNYFLNAEFSIATKEGFPSFLFAEKRGFLTAIYESGKQIFLYLPFTLPYWMFWSRIHRFAYVAVYISFLIAPLLFLFITIYSGSLIPFRDQFLLFILYSLLLFSKPFGIRFEEGRMHTIVVACAYALALCFDFYVHLKI